MYLGAHFVKLGWCLNNLIRTQVDNWGLFYSAGDGLMQSKVLKRWRWPYNSSVFILKLSKTAFGLEGAETYKSQAANSSGGC